MKYIVDTSVWSQALRREPVRPTAETQKLKLLLESGERIFLPGVILQEILQGVRQAQQSKKIFEALKYFPLLEAKREDYVFAAELYNQCRTKGFQGATIDFLIAALAIKNECILLSADRDFTSIAKHTALKLLT